MAERKVSEDDFNPRHRIVGAVVLVALAVIFLPMLLIDRPPSPGDGRMVPEETGSGTRVVVTPVPPPGDASVNAPVPSAGEAASASAGSAARTVVVPVEPTTEIGSAVKPPVTPEARPAETKTVPVAKTHSETAKAAPVAAPVKGWLVQVGAFSQADNARRLHEKLRLKGYPALLDPPNPKPGKTVRVEVGPYKDAAAAKAAQARIQGDFDIKGVIRKQ